MKIEPLTNTMNSEKLNSCTNNNCNRCHSLFFTSDGDMVHVYVVFMVCFSG